MDDIIAFSTSLQEHLDALSKVFEALAWEQKCFLKKEVEFLGHIVTDQGVKLNPSKIVCIQNWLFPKHQKELRGFPGLLGYYRKFIRDFAKITITKHIYYL